MLDQPSQQRTSGLQGNSRLLLQEVFEGPRKSVHRLNSTFDLFVALLSPLGGASGTISILDSVTEGNNAGLHHHPLARCTTTSCAATRALCAILSITLNFKFCTSPFPTLSVGVLNPLDEFCSALVSQLWTQHPPTKHGQHNQSQSSNRFSLPIQR